MKFFAVLTILGAVVGVFFLFAAFASDTYQAQAAGAATAVACVALPYCVARAIQMLNDSQVVILDRILSAMSDTSKTNTD